MVMKPTFIGYVPETHEALLLFQAVIDGVLEPITRRPQDQERRDMIQSGSIFVFYQGQSGIRRWTDHINWSPSRILGNFLLYRQLDKPPPRDRRDSYSSTTGHYRSNSAISCPDDNSPNHSPSFINNTYPECSHTRRLSSVSTCAHPPRPHSLSGSHELGPQFELRGEDDDDKREANAGSYSSGTIVGAPLKAEQQPENYDWSELDEENASFYHEGGEDGQFNPEWSLYGSLIQGNPQRFAYLQGGLVKKTISVQFGCDSLHMVSYYRASDVCNKSLHIPSSDPKLAALQINPELLNNSGSLRVPISAGRRGWYRPLSPIPAYANTFSPVPPRRPQTYAAGPASSVGNASYADPDHPAEDNRGKLVPFAPAGYNAAENSSEHAMDPALAEQGQHHENSVVKLYAYNARPHSQPLQYHPASAYEYGGYHKGEGYGHDGAFYGNLSAGAGMAMYAHHAHDYGGYDRMNTWIRNNAAPENIPLSPVSQDYTQRYGQFGRFPFQPSAQPSAPWSGRYLPGPDRDVKIEEGAEQDSQWVSTANPGYEQGGVYMHQWGQQPTPISSNRRDFNTAQGKTFQDPIKSPRGPTPPPMTASSTEQ